MASGLFALLDDVALIAKAAAASLDDVAAASAKAGSKAAGVVIDDAAVTPKYVVGFTPDRELPIIWKIAKGSLRNKLLILMPAFMALAAFLPEALTPLLMLGGAFLCFEAAEKVAEKLGLHRGGHGESATPVALASAAHESRMVTGAIRTDLILSAEILAIALGTLGSVSLGAKAAALALVSVLVTMGVYGAVALIVKMDDIGVRLAAHDNGLSRAFGRGLVAGMPKLLAALSVIGTAAMAWVGGGILVHGLEELGLVTAIPHALHGWAHAVGAIVPAGGAAVEWIANAALAGLFGLAVGAIIALVVTQASRLRRPQAGEAS